MTNNKREEFLQILNSYGEFRIDCFQGNLDDLMVYQEGKDLDNDLWNFIENYARDKQIEALEDIFKSRFDDTIGPWGKIRDKINQLKSNKNEI